MTDTVTYLFPPGNGQPGFVADTGTQICLNCPLHTRQYHNPQTGDIDIWPCSQVEIVTRDKSPSSIVCLNAYVLRQFTGLIAGGHWRIRALAIGDKLARQLLDPDDPDSAAAFRRAVDEYAGLLEMAARRLEPVANGNTAKTVEDIARRTLGQGRSAKAFRRAVDVWADRLEFMQQLGERNAKSQN